MATRVVVIWVLVLMVGWTSVFAFFNGYFDGGEFERKRIVVLEKKIHNSLRRIAQLDLSFSEYKDSMAAAGVKIQDNTKWTDSRRTLASVISDPEFKNIPRPQPGNIVLAKARGLYLAGDFGRAAELFDDFVRNYPDHPELPQAGYLLAESYFQTDQLESSVKAIDFVLTHFPETEFAGYSLLRLGKIFEREERLEEAAQMYQLVITEFAKSNSAALAEKNLKELNL